MGVGGGGAVILYKQCETQSRSCPHQRVMDPLGFNICEWMTKRLKGSAAHTTSPKGSVGVNRSLKIHAKIRFHFKSEIICVKNKSKFKLIEQNLHTSLSAFGLSVLL